MINRLVVRNLLHRPIRSGLSVLAVAIEVAMILLIVGLAEGLLHDSQQRTRGVGADIMIRPSTSSAAMSLSTADIPEKLCEKLQDMYPEIQMAVGTTILTPGELQTITGVNWDAFTRMAGGVRYIDGGPMIDPYDAVVDEVYARYKKIQPGDSLPLLNRQFRVSGVVESGKMSRIFIPIETMQELMGWQGELSQIYLKLHDPANTAELVEKLRALLPNYPVFAMEELLSQAAANIREMSSQFVTPMIGIAVIIGFIVVLLSMYTAILERTREIGILKSLGASKAYIVGIVMRETMVVCVCGIVAGVAIGYSVQQAIHALFPLMSVLISADWLLRGALIAFAGAVLGAMYPALRAARHDPIHALTYD